MDKYPLIGGSICAVVLLVLASLTNVVGYQTVKSTVVNDSPLFYVRTKRAINQGGKDVLTSNYLGKTNTLNLLIPPQSNRMELFHNAVRWIQTMDDSSFKKFVCIAFNQLSEQEKLTDITPQQLIAGLYQIRGNPQAFMDYSGSNNENITWKSTPTFCWYPGCHLINLVVTITITIMLIWLIIQIMIHGIPTASNPPTMCCKDCETLQI